MNESNYCVILAGGIGMRLWPSSRQDRPKQFLDILHTGESLLQSTFRRFSKFIDRDNIIVMSNDLYADTVREQLPELRADNLLLEPMRRNTVPSVTWAALEIARRCPDAVMVVSPSDQKIDDEECFERDILHGLGYASRCGRLLTLGVVPTRPETSYGYIQMADEMADDIYKVQSFTEKPEREFANLFYESKEFLWNTGLFIWGAGTFLNALHGTRPEYADMMEMVRQHYLGTEWKSVDEVREVFSKAPNMPLEQGVLEKVDNVDVLQCHFGWADIGTWEALHDVMPKSADSNNVVIDSKSLLYDCKDCIIKLPDGHVAVVQGLEGYVVVEEGNVLVICKKDDQKAIRKFVNDAQLNLGEEFV